MATELDISSLVNAASRLEEGFSRYQHDVSDDQIRDGLIQRFEFTYDLSHKMLKRYLELVSATPSQFDAMSFQDIIRTANEQGLLKGDWPAWRRFREMRGKTSHAYDINVALEVVKEIPVFISEVVFLHEELSRRLA